MSKTNLRTLGRVLAGLICVVGFSFAAGCSQSKCCGKDGQCCKQSAKGCPAGCAKACCKSASAKKCPMGCKKACCKNA